VTRMPWKEGCRDSILTHGSHIVSSPERITVRAMEFEKGKFNYRGERGVHRLSNGEPKERKELGTLTPLDGKKKKKELFEENNHRGGRAPIMKREGVNAAAL